MRNKERLSLYIQIISLITVYTLLLAVLLVPFLSLLLKEIIGIEVIIFVILECYIVFYMPQKAKL
jgi:hypothetical protein